MEFWKYSGAGNDFILIDDRDESFPIKNKILISKLCRRRLGIGADGIILLQNSKSSNFRIRIFNSDGSEAEMCGNGLRCAAKFLYHVIGLQDFYIIETINYTPRVSYCGDDVIASMAPPENILLSQKVFFENQSFRVDTINTGVPHAVIFMDDIENIDLKHIGKGIRYHEKFQPCGVNVNIAECCSNGKIKMRTYERGVEDETLSCGTGATAVAIAATFNKNRTPPIDIITRSGDILKIDFNLNNNAVDNVSICGPVCLVYHGFLTS